MSYSESFVIGWHDTDAGRIIRPTRMLTYLQETANHQCRKDGKDLDLMRDEDGMGFILTRLEMRTHALVRKDETIRFDTWISDTKGFSTCREFGAYRKDGTCVLEASSIWALVNVKTHELLKMSEYPYDYPRGEAHDFAPPMRLRMPEMTDAGSFRVGYMVTDYNGHMNNTFYPDLVMNFLPFETARDMYPSKMVILFHNGAPEGEVLRMKTGNDPEQKDTYFVSAENGAGQLCFSAKAELKKRTDF